MKAVNFTIDNWNYRYIIMLQKCIQHTMKGNDRENDRENCKFEVAGHARILKYKNIFTKGYTRNWSEEVFYD